MPTESMMALLDGPVSDAVNAAIAAVGDDACTLYLSARDTEWPGGADALARHITDARGSHWIVGAAGRCWVWEGDRWSLDAKDYLLEGVARHVIGELERRKREIDASVKRFEEAVLKVWPFKEVEEMEGHYFYGNASIHRLCQQANRLHYTVESAGIKRHAIYFVTCYMRADSLALVRTPPLYTEINTALLREMRRLRFDPQVKEAPAAPPPGVTGHTAP